jgi:hypothetical protein
MLRKRISLIARRIADWVETAAAYSAAAAIHEQLSHLSDAELKRRGISRETLARHVAETISRPT